MSESRDDVTPRQGQDEIGQAMKAWRSGKLENDECGKIIFTERRLNFSRTADSPPDAAETELQKSLSTHENEANEIRRRSSWYFEHITDLPSTKL